MKTLLTDFKRELRFRQKVANMFRAMPGDQIPQPQQGGMGGQQMPQQPQLQGPTGQPPQGFGGGPDDQQLDQIFMSLPRPVKEQIVMALMQQAQQGVPKQQQGGMPYGG